ncbi:hypothetical protein Tco_1556666 [Tanacetum coccineum]
MFDSHGLIPMMPPARALKSIQDMVNHSPNWYDRATTWQRSSHNSNDIVGITNRLYRVGCNMEKLKESIYVIQVGCKICEGVHLTQECFLKEEGKEDEAQAFRTLEGLKKVKINRPLIRDVKKMPEYLKYMKDVFSSKKPINEEDATKLNERCSLYIKNALADLRASINVMPFSMFKRLNIGNLQPTNMIVEMPDMTKKAPRGIIENMLVQMDKFIFPVDFVMIDMVEDPKAPLILGRPLLETGHARIDVFNKQISLGASYDPCVEKCDSETRREDVRNLWAYIYDDDRIKIPWKDMPFENWIKFCLQVKLNNIEEVAVNCTGIMAEIDMDGLAQGAT